LQTLLHYIKQSKINEMINKKDYVISLDNHLSHAILVFLQGTNAVEGLTLELTSQSKVNFNSEAFIKMQRLRLLQLDYVRLTGDYKYLSKELRWLCWHGFPLKFIPNEFYPRNLVVIDLQYSNLKKVWEGPKV
jgi:hypothetical protein